MTCNSHDLLCLAKTLHELNSDEAMHRCVVSRAYYAALHRVEDVFPARAEQFRRDGESSHAEIIGRALAYGNQLVPGRSSAAQIAKAITRLRHERNFADYKIEYEFEKTRSADALYRAENILKLCDDVVAKIALAPTKTADAVNHISTQYPIPPTPPIKARPRLKRIL